MTPECRCGWSVLPPHGVPVSVSGVRIEPTIGLGLGGTGWWSTRVPDEVILDGPHSTVDVYVSPQLWVSPMAHGTSRLRWGGRLALFQSVFALNGYTASEPAEWYSGTVRGASLGLYVAWAPSTP